MNKLLAYIFFLSMVLIAVVYYVGVQTDTTAFTGAFQQIIYAATGRNTSGNFANYPVAQASA